MKEIIYLSFVAASISFTISETKLFKPLREWVKKKHSVLGELLFCGYCFGHWGAFALVIIFRPKLFEYWWMADYLLTVLVIAWLSAFQWALMCWFMDKAGK